jgi:hypothetical protein
VQKPRHDIGSEIFRPHQGTDQIYQQQRGNHATKNEIEHRSDRLASRDVHEQQSKNEKPVDQCNRIIHIPYPCLALMPVNNAVSAFANAGDQLKPSDDCRGEGIKIPW